jgi:hypothetical protein
MRERLTRPCAAVLAVAVCLAVLAACSPRGAVPGTGSSTRPPESADSTATTSTAGSGAPDASLAFSALDLDIVFRQVQSMDVGGVPIENTIEATGRVRLTVDTAVSPPAVRGEGSLPVAGSGRAGGVAFTNSGTIAYRFEGVIVRIPSGRLELRLRGQRSMNVQARPVGPSSVTPFEAFAEQTLAAEDGYVHEWSWQQSGAGITGTETWTVRIPGGQ